MPACYKREVSGSRFMLKKVIYAFLLIGADFKTLKYIAVVHKFE